jgi:hypothetical protein
MDPSLVTNWSANWAWSLPLVALTVVFHAFGLGLIDNKVVSQIGRGVDPRVSSVIPGMVVGATAIAATILHGIEGVFWGVAYRLLGALPDSKSAMLYSLNAMTSYGHTDLHLQDHWQLMGALEALNGWILFGLTTAFLFGVIQKIWLHEARGRQPKS